MPCAREFCYGRIPPDPGLKGASPNPISFDVLFGYSAYLKRFIKMSQQNAQDGQVLVQFSRTPVINSIIRPHPVSIT